MLDNNRCYLGNASAVLEPADAAHDVYARGDPSCTTPGSLSPETRGGPGHCGCRIGRAACFWRVEKGVGYGGALLAEHADQHTNPCSLLCEGTPGCIAFVKIGVTGSKLSLLVPN